MIFFVFFFKQKTAYEMRISDWSSDVCSSDLDAVQKLAPAREQRRILEREARVEAARVLIDFAVARRVVAARLRIKERMPLALVHQAFAGLRRKIDAQRIVKQLEET